MQRLLDALTFTTFPESILFFLSSDEIMNNNEEIYPFFLSHWLEHFTFAFTYLFCGKKGKRRDHKNRQVSFYCLFKVNYPFVPRIFELTVLKYSRVYKKPIGWKATPANGTSPLIRIRGHKIITGHLTVNMQNSDTQKLKEITHLSKIGEKVDDCRWT